MGIGVSLIAVITLMLLAYLGVAVGSLQYLFGVIIPYMAFALFIVGVIYRVVKWGRSPVPFRIPTTCGQTKSLDWVKPNKIDNPTTTGAVVVRMLLEVLLFRSLFRNVRAEIHDGNIAYKWQKWLWIFGLMFHWSFFLVVVRHMRFFTDPIPGFIQGVAAVDGFFEFGLQGLYITGLLLLAAVTYLFLRRVAVSEIRYISLLSDYFPLLVIMGIASTGILMRYVLHVDVIAVKELTMGLVTFNPVVPEGVSSVLFMHVFLVSVLLAYFPFSKLMHAGGVMLSPTRNMANDSRERRHVNPWNAPVHVHSYEEYEDEFRDKMIKVGIPVDKQESA